jgi:hypothetical protein
MFEITYFTDVLKKSHINNIICFHHRIVSENTYYLSPSAVLGGGGIGGVQDCKIPRTSGGSTRKWKARDRDKLIETTPEKLLFKVLWVSPRNIDHTRETWKIAES